MKVNRPLGMKEIDLIEKPRITPLGGILAFICWALYAVLFSLAIAAAEQGPFLDVLVGQFVGTMILFALTVPAWWFILREMDNRSWWLRIAAHLLYAPLFGWLGMELFLFYTQTFIPNPEVSEAIEEAYPFIVGTNITLYFVYFAVLHAVRAISRLRYQRRRAAELLALARESELAALKAQLNPHFLFNTLNSISALAGDDAEATRSMIRRLAEMLRYAIDSSKRDMVSLQEEIEFTKAYLAIEEQRMADRLTVEWRIDEGALDELIPPIIIQPLVENAVKHGITPLESGGKISITVHRNTDHIDISVKDNGVGVSPEWNPEDSNGIGLANTKMRLEKRFGAAASFNTAIDPAGGFLSEFTVPIYN